MASKWSGDCGQHPLGVSDGQAAKEVGPSGMTFHRDSRIKGSARARAFRTDLWSSKRAALVLRSFPRVLSTVKVLSSQKDIHPTSSCLAAPAGGPLCSTDFFNTYPCKDWNTYPECPRRNYQPDRYCQYCIVGPLTVGPSTEVDASSRPVAETWRIEPVMSCSPGSAGERPVSVQAFARRTAAWPVLASVQRRILVE